MMSTSRPRWTWLLVLPALVGALLLMHGLDARVGTSHQPGTEHAAGASAHGVEPHSHPHSHTPPDHADEAPGSEHGHCGDCLAGHVMAACVAVLTAIATVEVGRRLLARLDAGVVTAAVAQWVRNLAEQARPPDPAWVRLSVMRC